MRTVKRTRYQLANVSGAEPVQASGTQVASWLESRFRLAYDPLPIIWSSATRTAFWLPERGRSHLAQGHVPDIR